MYAWLGNTDIKAARSEIPGLGPIAAALANRPHYRELHLLWDLKPEEMSLYQAWLKQRYDGEIFSHRVDLENDPTDYHLITKVVMGFLAGEKKRQKGARSWVFHLSPGTPAMTAVWILMSQTKYPATLIQTSEKYGLRDVRIPFDIAAEYVPEILEKADRALENRMNADLGSDVGFGDIIYRSLAMKEVVARARRLAKRGFPVLIEGASGTGKELFARALHKESIRGDKPFLVANCGAFPSDLMESELFGHEKGAYTGADKKKEGLFRAADGGVLFLDEIGELPLAAQVKLLRVLQEKKVRPVGGEKEIPVDVRVISATNRNLSEEVAAGRFREDLFYRLAVGVLHLPVLVEREGDLGILIDHFLERANQQNAESELGYQVRQLGPSAKSRLLQHGWPGNIRELQNTMLRLTALSDETLLDAGHVEEALITPKTPRDRILDRGLEQPIVLNDVLGEVVRHYFTRAWRRTSGHKGKAAKLLGFNNYQTMDKWAGKYGWQAPDL